ncbi:EAL domain-containing protein [Novosphingobium sp. PP1Y]|uniref:EAL domain-containing protein n=1 Tax=Novosphingobium sp. PP1Y TaxID=702113 RepID=UPI0002EC4618|nr:EAL domain-containing protein [Novosphingobium sp. PP1Y]
MSQPTIAPRTCHMAFRLNNAQPITAAYGQGMVTAAMDHFAASLQRYLVGLHGYLGPVELDRSGENEIMVACKRTRIGPEVMRTLIDELCAGIAMDPLRHDGRLVLLSVTAGCAFVSLDAGIEADAAEHEACKAQARLRLADATMPSDGPLLPSQTQIRLYREDMVQAAALLERIGREEAFFVWRPIFKPQEPDRVLHYEALLRLPGEQGEQLECTLAYAALERLGLAYLADKHAASRVLDELEADPLASISFAISAQSLSPHLHGRDAAWTELLARLRADKGLAARLVLEIHETAPMTGFAEVQALVGQMRALGARICIAGFGSGFASTRQLLMIQPDIVKLDSIFLHTAYQCERNRNRISHLIGLARTLSNTLVIDGVETPWHMKLAREENVQWIAGPLQGRASTRRAWLAKPQKPRANGGEETVDDNLVFLPQPAGQAVQLR